VQVVYVEPIVNDDKKEVKQQVKQLKQQVKQLKQLKQLKHLNTKKKILLYIKNSPKTISELTKELKESIETISQNLYSFIHSFFSK